MEELETQHVRCMKCNRIIKCARNDTTKLIDHIRTEHPEVTVVESDTGNAPKRSTSGCSKASSCCPKNPSSSACCPQKCHLFRASIEHWRPAKGCIYCPFCCCKKQPLVKMRNERLSGNSFTANCMLACWPLCFLPFLVSGTDKEYLYCSNCKTFLGLYDRRRNCVKPNRQFADRLKEGK